MPLYEFYCRDCQKTFEREEPISEHGKTPVTCPSCKSANVERRWTSVYAVTSKKS